MAGNYDDEAVQRITANAICVALQQDRDERDRQSQLATQAAVAAALANQTQQVNALRKPDLPPFDKDNIHIWIKRLENAYCRSNVNTPQAKFAFLESKFDVKSDPKINKYLYGEQTAADWTEFLDYLREKYGRTRRQEVYTILNGTPREERKPSQLLELIKERAGGTTLDDIYKELVLKEMPKDLKLLVAAQVEGLNAEKTAKYLDKYFDAKGKVLHSEPTTSVNHVTSSKPPPQQQQQKSSFTSPFPNDADPEPEVNAVRFKSGQRQQFDVSNHSSSSSRGRGSGNSNYSSFNRSSSSNGRFSGSSSGSSNSSNNNAASNSSGNRTSNKKVCHFHVNHGEQAENCGGSWCLLYGKLQPKGQASRR